MLPLMKRNCTKQQGNEIVLDVLLFYISVCSHWTPPYESNEAELRGSTCRVIYITVNNQRGHTIKFLDDR